jgi:hypothetical protein
MLSEAYAEARLTLGDFAERLSAARSAETPEELGQVVSDVPSTPVFRPEDGTRRTLAVMGGSSRRGPWRPTRHTSVTAFMGGCHLDLRDAYVEGSELDITARAIMGGVTIVVPEGVEVALSGFALMGGKSARISRTPPLPGTPRINVRARVLMGGVTVTNKRHRRRPAPRARRRA